VLHGLLVFITDEILYFTLYVCFVTATLNTQTCLVDLLIVLCEVACCTLFEQNKEEEE